MVYALYDAERGLVKIGHTIRGIELRHAEHERDQGRVLQVLACLPGGREEEKALHRRFADDRITGEWFRVSKSLRSWLNCGIV